MTECKPMPEDLEKTIQHLANLRRDGVMPENCREKYLDILRKIEVMKTQANANDLADALVLSNEYSKFFSRGECLEMIVQVRNELK